MKSILCYFGNQREVSSSLQQLSNGSTNMPPPSFPSEVLTTTAVDDVDDVEGRKETGEGVGSETCIQQECAASAPKKKRLVDVPIVCKQRCCNDTSATFQTTDNTILNKTMITYPDGKNRRFQVAWYKQYSWVVLCETKAKAFYFFCRFATSHAMMVFSSKAEDAFVTEGFCNWKHAKDKFNNHEESSTFRSLPKVQHFYSAKHYRAHECSTLRRPGMA